MLSIFYEIEPNKEDDVYSTSGIGAKSFVREGKLTMRYIVEATPVVMSQLRSMNGVDWSAWIISSEGFIKGWTSDRTKFEPFSIQNFRVEGETPAAGDTPSLVPIEVTYDDPTQWNNNPAFVEPLRDGVSAVWNPRDLKDPKAIISTVTSATITGFTIKLEGYDKVAHEGAVKEDIRIELVSDGSITALTTLTETSTPGTYTAVATIAADTYYIGMHPVGYASMTQGFAELRADLTDETHVVS